MKRQHLARWGLPAIAILGVLFATSALYVQGLDLGEDGFWILGARLSNETPGLHGSLELAEATGRFQLLRGAMKMLGDNARSLAWLQSLLAALSSLGGGWILWRMGAGFWSALFPLAVIALGPVPPWLFPSIAIAVARMAQRDRIAVVLCAAAAAFGLGSFLVGLAVFWLPVGLGIRRPPIYLAPISLGAGALVVVFIGNLSGDVLQEFKLGWIDPGNRAVDALRGGSIWAWWNSFRTGPHLSLPFAELSTGEELGPRWPGHGALRGLAHRLLYLGLIAGGSIFLWQKIRGRSASALALIASALLALRGDLPQLHPAALLAIPGWFSLAASTRARRALMLLLTVAILPMLAEKMWLLAHYYRDEIVLFDQPGGEILLERQRVTELGRLSEALHEAGPPILVWPNAAGLHVLTDMPTATRYVRQPVEDRSAELIATLSLRPPPHVLLAPGSIRGAQAITVAQPGLHEWLRSRYQLLGSYLGGADRFRVLALLPEGTEPSELSLNQRLPFAEMGVGTEPGPTLQKDLAVGQSFLVGSTNFAGVSLRWNSDRPNVTLPLRFHLWAWSGDGYNLLLHFFDTDLHIPESGHRSYLRIGPVADSARLRLAITFQLREQIDAEVQPLWHRHDTGSQPIDFYTEGTALLNDEPVAADLYFAAY